jgi:hypothetical protein
MLVSIKFMLMNIKCQIVTDATQVSEEGHYHEY